MFPHNLGDAEAALVGLLLRMQEAALGLFWYRDGLPLTISGLLLEWMDCS